VAPPVPPAADMEELWWVRETATCITHTPHVVPTAAQPSTIMRDS